MERGKKKKRCVEVIPQEPEVMHSFWFQLFEAKKEHKDKCVLVF